MTAQDAGQKSNPANRPLQSSPGLPSSPSDSRGAFTSRATSSGVARRLFITAIGVSPVVAVLAVLGSRLGQGGGRSAIGVNSETQQAPLQPRPAPDFRLTTFDGDEFQLSAHRGDVVVINFWASWCGPCQLEASHLEATHRRLAPQGFIMLGIDVWDDDPDALAFIEDFDISYVNAPDPSGKIAIDFAITGIPETFMIDRKGVVVQHWIGPLTEDRLVASIQPLLDEPPP